MVFSSIVFLFFFLPIVLILYFASDNLKFRNALLLLASLVFYAWGEGLFVLLMLTSVCINWLIGLLLARHQNNPKRKKHILTLGVLLNLLPLLYFKYANFIADAINSITQTANISPLKLEPIHLPIGISFFTFQAISYIVDVYRDDAKVQNKFNSVALYIALFPQLIAGPIVRYQSVAEQLNHRSPRLEDIATGSLRFINGLGKKVLIANPVGAVADQIFALPMDSISTPLAWLGILAYTVQIFFDFSGYSDMAIGLGKIFGFSFPENFNYPYFSKSVSEFWRRWHMSLSSWFRDYLYIPLGGNRSGAGRTFFNLVIVFFLCGLWHGASWTFVIWGLYHGFFLVIERMGLSRLLSSLPSVINHVYLLVIIMIGWVFFRADNVHFALDFLHRLFVYKDINYMDGFLYNALNPIFYAALLMGVLLSTPVALRFMEMINNNTSRALSYVKTPLCAIWSIAIFTICVVQLLSSSYNPFLYFRF